MKDTRFTQLQEEASASQERVHELLEGERTQGFTRGSKHSLEAIDYLVDILERAGQGEYKAEYELKEASMLSDFPTLFGDVLDRSMMAYYQAWIPDWSAYVKSGRPLKDFRDAKRMGIIGLQDTLSEVGEREEAPERHPSEETPITVSVSKYSAKFGISFETVVNDDLGALAELPQTLAIGARRTEALKVAQMFVGTSGFNTGVYTAGNANIVNTTNGATGTNPVLSMTSLQDALMILAKQKDAYGHPILIEGVELVVPPALEVTAQNILNGLQVNVAQGGGAYNAQNQLVTGNWLKNRVGISVNPYIPYVSSTANGNTSWFVTARPLANRPAFEFYGLAGHEGPELFVKAPNASRVGGGMDRFDFDTEVTWYKIRDIFGCSVIDAHLTVASNGSGS